MQLIEVAMLCLRYIETVGNYISFIVFCFILWYKIDGDNMYGLFLLFISILPVVLIGYYIYRKDRDKEPVRLLASLFCGGILSCILTIFVTMFLSLFFPFFLASEDTFSFVELVFYVFFGIAFIEEFMKWVFVYRLSFNSIYFDQAYDMIVYSVFCALGFACLENIFYVFDGGIKTAIIRALFAVPGHACDGVFMGYYLARAKLSYFSNNFIWRDRNMFLSILVPVFLHGFYDFCLYSGSVFFVLVFLVFVLILYVVSFKKIKSFSMVTDKIKYSDNFCPVCGRRVCSLYCPGCGRKND